MDFTGDAFATGALDLTGAADTAFFETAFPGAAVLDETADFADPLAAAFLGAAFLGAAFFTAAFLFGTDFFGAAFFATDLVACFVFFLIGFAAFFDTAFFGAAFLDAAFFGAAFLDAAFFGADFLEAAFLDFTGAAFFLVADFFELLFFCISFIGFLPVAFFEVFAINKVSTVKPKIIPFEIAFTMPLLLQLQTSIFIVP
ncbi:MAG: hypothetical protein ABJA78_15440 [Ferruginibacter sp.]